VTGPEARALMSHCMPEFRSPESEAGAPDPLVSVLMTAYNHERFVALAIDSIFRQTYPNLELVIIDDCSPDGTAAIIEETVRNAPIPVTFRRNVTNLGVTRTLNRALELSRGEWICFIASDDYHDPAFVERSLQYCLETPGCKFVHCDGHYVEEDGTVAQRIYEISKLPPVLPVGSFDSLIEGKSRIVAVSVFFARELVCKLGGFDEDLVSEDFDFHLRIARQYPIHFLNEPLVFSRITRGSLGRSPRRYLADGLKILQKHADLVGARLPYLKMRKVMRNSDMGFYSGDFSTGVQEGLHAIRLAPSLSRRLQCTVTLVLNIGKYQIKRLVQR
jgi:glycosyltransferase involved in cell wall biosynthesis